MEDFENKEMEPEDAGISYFDKNALNPNESESKPDSEEIVTPENHSEGEPEEHPYDKTQIFRHVIQGVSFFLFPALFFTLLQSCGKLLAAAARGSFSLSAMSEDLVLLGGILLITILWGRFFCGYLCAVGAAGDLIYFLSEKILPEKWKIKDQTDKRLKYLKYFILILMAGGVWLSFSPVTADLIPQNLFSWRVSEHGQHSYAMGRIGLLFILLFIAGSFFIERFFCRYLCPAGALFTPLSKLRLFKVRRDISKCNGCHGCCMGIDAHGKSKITSGECVSCMRCAAVKQTENQENTEADASAGSPKSGNHPEKTSPALTGILASAALLIIIAASSLFSPAHNRKNDLRADHGQEMFGEKRDGGRGNFWNGDGNDFKNPDQDDNGRRGRFGNGNRNDSQNPDQNQDDRKDKSNDKNNDNSQKPDQRNNDRRDRFGNRNNSEDSGRQR